MKACLILCLLVAVNVSLLLPSQMNMVFEENRQADVSVATSCTSVTQKVFSGYLNVAAGSNSGLAFIFYGSQKAKTLAEIPKYPTVIWLQGGPGSSSQLGNFLELGPIRINVDGTQTVNKASWDTEYNVMFVDQPIGTGFSQFAATSEIPVNQDHVGQHFLYALLQFLAADKGCVKQNADLSGLLTSPWFLFGESYAGKYVPAIAEAILKYTAVAIPLKGIGIGDGFTDPLTIMKEMPSFGFNMGLIDYQERSKNEKKAIQGSQNIKAQNWLAARQNFYDVCGYIVKQGGNLNWYNIFHFDTYEKQINQINNYLQDTATKKLLGFNPDYSFSMSSTEVYNSLSEDFMKSDCLARLEYVLTKLPVIIYNGQNDLMVPSPGTLRWVYNLNHSATKEFQAADLTPWKVGDKIVGYKKSAGNLEFRIVNQAGQFVPMDQPDNALDMVKSFIESHKK